MRIRKLAAAALVSVAAIGLSACATGLPTQVSRHQAMPIAKGQSFYIMPASGGQPSLEFGRYAALTARHLEANGYRAAGAPQLADMIVKLNLTIGEGETEHTIDPMARSRYGYGAYGDPFYRSSRDPFYGGYRDPFYRGTRDPFYRGYRDPFGRNAYDPFYRGYYGRPYYSRYGYGGLSRSPYYFGWDDPYWYASPYAGYGSDYREPIRSYTVYESELDMDIVRRADNAPLFEGKAKARSQTDEASVLFPNLIEAMFTGFPGRSGETVKITVPARKR
jgi:hypothetical protein